MLPSANPADDQNVLHGVAVVSASDAWAVGKDESRMHPGPFQTLAEHWDGAHWSVSPTPNIGESNLEAVAAVSSRDVWAVGAHVDTSNTTLETLTEHWDGTQWSIVPSPGLGSLLVGVVAPASNDVWAVGQVYSGNSHYAQLVEHWNGTQWSTTAMPTLAPNTTSTLEGIAAMSASDIWAVGYSFSTAVSGSPALPLMEHWNGAQWTIVPGAPIGSGGLMAVAAVSSNNVWAVGGQSPPNSGPVRTLVEHWNGAQWSVVASPNPGLSLDHPGSAYLSVTTSSSGDVWAAGLETDASASFVGFDTGVGFFTHWSGQHWDVKAAPAQPHDWRIWHMATGHAGDVWAVGSVDTFAVTTDSKGTLIEYLA